MTAPTPMPRVGFDGSLSMRLAAPLLIATTGLLHSTLQAAIKLLEGNPFACVSSRRGYWTATEMGPDNPQSKPSHSIREHARWRRASPWMRRSPRELAIPAGRA